ncbi:MAG: P-loop NTPase [Deltaproteobacteria bacterium]|nr:P-loop NTPase [Deltaproteobacteria bacterium]
MSFFKNVFYRKAAGNEGKNRDAGEQRFSVVKPLQAGHGTRVFAIGGGKGGVGKSLITSNMGALLAKRGRKVLMVDADLGAANLHTFFGLSGSKLSFSSFLKSEVADIRQVISKTDMPELDLISGAKDSLDAADMGGGVVTRLRQELRSLDYDYALLDIGPGTSSNILDMFLLADHGILVTTPEPTATENTYRFLKCLFLYRIKKIINSQKDTELKDLLLKVFGSRPDQKVKTVSDILNRLRELDPRRGKILGDLLGDTMISIILNQARPADKQMGANIKKACFDYFGVPIGYLGDIAFDDAASESIRKRTPLTVYDSRSAAANGIGASLDRLLDLEGEGRMETASGNPF